MIKSFMARFLSPDIVVQDPASTQSYSRYSYVRNNPLNYVDPSGYEFVDQIDGSTEYHYNYDFGLNPSDPTKHRQRDSSDPRGTAPEYEDLGNGLFRDSQGNLLTFEQAMYGALVNYGGFLENIDLGSLFSDTEAQGFIGGDIFYEHGWYGGTWHVRFYTSGKVETWGKPELVLENHISSRILYVPSSYVAANGGDDFLNLHTVVSETSSRNIIRAPFWTVYQKSSVGYSKGSGPIKIKNGVIVKESKIKRGVFTLTTTENGFMISAGKGLSLGVTDGFFTTSYTTSSDANLGDWRSTYVSVTQQYKINPADYAVALAVYYFPNLITRIGTSTVPIPVFGY